MYVAKGKYAEHAKEAAFVKEGVNKPLATKATNVYVMPSNNKPH
jgi:hypothetical protein